MKRPNLFKIATSEFSQDAFIVWLLQWADIRYATIDAKLNGLAKNFVRALINVSCDYEIKEVEAGRQWNNIDIWTAVNNEYIIVIEDKKGTKEHSDQLMRYAESVKEYYKNNEMKIILIYFKMEEQSNYTVVEKAGFSLFNREKMLKILGCYHSGTGEQVNNILLDYMDYLLELDENIKSFQSLPLNKWNWYSWKGFFSTIQKVFVGGEWDYVPNPAGGFLGFWWCWNYNNWNGKEFEYYLQLEQDQLVFKLYAYKPEDRYEIREYYRNKLYPAAKKQGANIQQYGRIGTYMGVAKLSGDYRIPGNDGLIDLSATIDNLRRMEQLITETEKELSIT